MFKDIKLKYLLSYLNERFPLVNMLLFVILYAMVFSVLQMTQGANKHSFIFHILGALSVISFFFRLRVFDEMKDYKMDVINHPNRVLQSGKINLITLQLIALLGLMLEIYWVYHAGNSAIIFWLLTLGYSFVMRYEFFVPSFLNKNLLLYATSHMLIMPLIILWVWMSQLNVILFNIELFYLLVLSLVSGFAFEIARKTRAPEAERETVDSYSKQIGLNNAQYLILFLCFSMALSLILLFIRLDVPIYLYIIISAAFLWILWEYYQTINNATEDKLRKNEKKVSLMMLLAYLSLIILNFI